MSESPSVSNRPFIQGNSVWITTVAFQQLFKDMEVRNYDSRYGEPTRRMLVQTSLDTKERIYYQLKHGGFRALEQQDTRLPRLSIELNDISPRLTDYTGKEQKRVLFREDDGRFSYDIQPVPVNVTYTLGLWTNYYDHYVQLVENIFGLFDPYVTVGVKERNFNIEREIKYKLESHSQGHTFKVRGNETRVIRGSMSFSADSFMYKIIFDKNNLDPAYIKKMRIYNVDLVTPISSEMISISGEL